MNKSSTLVLAVSSATAAVFLSSCKPAAPAETAPAPATPPTAAVAPETETPSAGSEVELKDPVATVNGEAISKTQLDDAFQSAVKAAGVPLTQLAPEQKMEGYRQLLDELILDKLITKAAAGFQVSEDEVNKELTKIKGQFPDEAAFNKQLSDAGQTPEKLVENLKKMLQQQHWLDSQIADKTTVTDEDARKFYDENKQEFEEGDSVKASHILFKVDADASEEVQKEKLEAAKKAIQRAKKEDFATLAKELSEDPGSAQTGGDLGFFTKDRMVPEFADAAFAQAADSVSAEPVKTQFGYHVIKVVEKKPAHTTPFEEVKDQLKAYLKSSKQREAVKELLDKLRGEAKIENTLPPRPEAPAMPMVPGAEQAPSGAPASEAAPETPSQGN